MNKVIVAPLNWGLGHATRCIPLISYLREQGINPVIASDGVALELLVREFPSLETLVLPSYKIRYGKKLKASLFLQIPTISRAVKKERAIIAQYVSQNKDVIGIISDNRFGARSDQVTSVYLSHQLRVLSGLTTFLTSWVHQRYIAKFDECWVPDTNASSFSGRLSQVTSMSLPIRHLGILSRISPKKLAKKNDLLIILSGPEPNRTHFENRLLNQLKDYQGKVCLVRGTTRPFKNGIDPTDLEIHDLMVTSELEQEINQSDVVLCRSGYSSIMDMASLGKKGIFIPTKGQYEQEYLARNLKERGHAHFASEDDFTIEAVRQLKGYPGFKITKMSLDLPVLDLFKRK